MRLVPSLQLGRTGIHQADRLRHAHLDDLSCPTLQQELEPYARPSQFRLPCKLHFRACFTMRCARLSQLKSGF